MTASVRVRAPVRVLDAGGWTDTWFAGRGVVCHLAVDDGAEVVARSSGPAAPHACTVELRVPDLGDRYRFTLDRCPGRHPLLEAALRRWAPDVSALDVTVRAAVPPASGLGTSASVVVALIAALQALGGGRSDPGDLAAAAHRIETVDVGLQSGVQDQVAASYGGCNLVVVDPYPDAAVRALELAPATWEGLARRVVTVHLGAPRRSSAVHDAVIAGLTSGKEELLTPLRAAARRAADALLAGDFDAYGAAMVANSEAQAALHPALVSPAARQVFDLAHRLGAVGWKVNGAGGEGGTVSVVGAEDPGELVAALRSTPGLQVLALRPAREGVRVVDRS